MWNSIMCVFTTVATNNTFFIYTLSINIHIRTHFLLRISINFLMRGFALTINCIRII